MPTKQRGDGWQAAFMVDGKRYRQQFETLAKGEDWETEVRLALRRGQSVPQVGRAAPLEAKPTTLGELFDYTCTHEWAGKKAEEFLVRNGRMVVEHFGRSKRVAEITPFDVDGMVKVLRDARKAEGTINRKLAALSKMLAVAIDLGVIQAKPKIKRRKEPEGRLRFLTEAEEPDLLAALWMDNEDLDTRYRDLSVFLLDTGLRVGEALSLDWRDVTSAQITVLAAKAKGGKSRAVPLTQRSKAVLDALRGRETGPFANLRYHNYRKRFDAAVTKLGLTDVVIHTLRHTTASRLVMRGVDIYRVMKFMGHANVRTTMRYAHLAPDSLNALAGILEPQAAPERQLEVA